MSDLKLHAKDFTQWQWKVQSVLDFFKVKLTDLGWDKGERDEVIMDIGCGPGGTTKDIILPYFPNVEKIIGIDEMTEMINIAKRKNAHPKIEYVVADITEWSTVQQWEEKIIKCISIHCFHWVKDQRSGFRNVHRLLLSGGQAAFFFVLECNFFHAIQNLQNSAKWSHYLKGHDNRIPSSHHYKYDAAYYAELVKSLGFQVLYCKNEEMTDVYPSDETFKNFFSSLCVLMPYIPHEHQEDFKNDIVKQMVEISGRTPEGLPVLRSQILEMIVRKTN